MKQALGLLFIIAILYTTLSRSLVLAGFMIRKSYIQSSVCVNRFNPKSSCAGKCFLKKHLAEEGQKDSPKLTGQDENSDWATDPGQNEIQLFLVTGNILFQTSVRNICIGFVEHPFLPPETKCAVLC